MDRDTCVCIGVTREYRDWLKRLAAHRGHTISMLVERAIRQYADGFVGEPRRLQKGVFDEGK